MKIGLIVTSSWGDKGKNKTHGRENWKFGAFEQEDVKNGRDMGASDLHVSAWKLYKLLIGRQCDESNKPVPMKKEEQYWNSKSMLGPKWNNSSSVKMNEMEAFKLWIICWLWGLGAAKWGDSHVFDPGPWTEEGHPWCTTALGHSMGAWDGFGNLVEATNGGDVIIPARISRAESPSRIPVLNAELPC